MLRDYMAGSILCPRRAGGCGAQRAVFNEPGMDRSAAIAALERGSIKVLFAVDVFNEGVDIPSLDTVMFLRPTESYVVFLQQLGRGLRKHPGKHGLTVIDFIGNYRRAHHLPRLLAGENPWLEREAPRHTPTDEEYPEGYRELRLPGHQALRRAGQGDPLPERLRDTYWRIKTALGRQPTRVDVYEGSDIPIKYLEAGGLGSWILWASLPDEESAWLSGASEAFLREVERTSLTKAYKPPP